MPSTLPGGEHDGITRLAELVMLGPAEVDYDEPYGVHVLGDQVAGQFRVLVGPTTSPRFLRPMPRRPGCGSTWSAPSTAPRPASPAAASTIPRTTRSSRSLLSGRRHAGRRGNRADRGLPPDRPAHRRDQPSGRGARVAPETRPGAVTATFERARSSTARATSSRADQVARPGGTRDLAVLKSALAERGWESWSCEGGPLLRDLLAAGVDRRAVRDGGADGARRRDTRPDLQGPPQPATAVARAAGERRDAAGALARSDGRRCDRPGLDVPM